MNNSIFLLFANIFCKKDDIFNKSEKWKGKSKRKIVINKKKGRYLFLKYKTRNDVKNIVNKDGKVLKRKLEFCF